MKPKNCPVVVRRVEGVSFFLCPVCGMLFGGDRSYGAHPSAEGIGIDRVMASMRQEAVLRDNQAVTKGSVVFPVLKTKEQVKGASNER